MRPILSKCPPGMIAAIFIASLIQPGAAKWRAAESRPQNPQTANDIRRSVSIFLQEGKVETALKRALTAYKADPGKPLNQALLGDVYYRMADFDKAESLYRSAAAADPAEARAWLGLGRLDLLGFCRRTAREKLARAYALDPSDPDVIRAYASNAGRVSNEVALLKKYLALGKSLPRQDLEAAFGHLIFHEKTGNRRLGVLASEYRDYQLPLFASQEKTLLLQVNINDGRPLRLVLDTGARGIAISAAAARSLGLRYIVQSWLDGMGDSGPTSANTAIADTIRIDDLTYRDCAVDVSDRPLFASADGVIGSVLFQQFLVNLDFPRKTLNLVPFAGGASQISGEDEDWSNHDREIPAGMEHFIPISQINNLIFVQARLRGTGGGYFLVDTGASFSSISKSFTPDVNYTYLGASFALHGAAGDVQKSYRAYPFVVQFANCSFVDPGLIALDMRAISNREGIEVAGFVGCPMLSRSKISINYRDGLLSVEAPPIRY